MCYSKFFTAQKPNQRWVADFTYVATEEGWLYVAAVLDLFSRRIVGLAMSNRITDDWVMAALQQALIHRKPNAGLIHHSDNIQHRRCQCGWSSPDSVESCYAECGIVRYKVSS